MFKHNCINALEHNFFSTPVLIITLPPPPHVSLPHFVCLARALFRFISAFSLKIFEIATIFGSAHSLNTRSSVSRGH